LGSKKVGEETEELRRGKREGEEESYNEHGRGVYRENCANV